MLKERLFRWVALLLVLVPVVCMVTACTKNTDKGASSSPSPEKTEGESDGEKMETSAPQPSPEVQDLTETSLKDVFADDFLFGVAINRYQLEKKKAFALITEQFNSMTMENEMKPEGLLDEQASQNSKDGMPRIRTDNLEAILKIAQANGIKMRGHVLIWHNQTPEWFFCIDYNPSKGFVKKNVMLKRMESYIRQVLEFCQDNYPGVLTAWDVVNEAVDDSAPAGYRSNSKWFEIIGEEFVEKAFAFARKYAADDVKLFYNDYNCSAPAKRDFIAEMVSKLKEKDLIDGVGMQGHLDMDYPTVFDLEEAILLFSDIEGIEVQLTEIDMHNNSKDPDALLKQAERYGQIFAMLLKLDREGKADITSVTFWGLTDDVTWLTNFRGETSYPLLFDAYYKPKAAVEYIKKAAAEYAK